MAIGSAEPREPRPIWTMSSPGARFRPSPRLLNERSHLLTKSKPFDEIFLQWWESPEITWCADQIDGPEYGDEDWRYLLATPVREAAPELLECLEEALAYFVSAWKAVDNHPASHYRGYVEDYRAAIAKAMSES